MALGRVFSISYGSSTCLKPLAECTPAEIQEIVSDGNAAKAWKVGDVTKQTWSISSYGRARLIGIDHNKELETDGKHNAHFLLFFKSNKSVAWIVNGMYRSELGSGYMVCHKLKTSGTITNSGGWASSQLLKSIGSFYFKTEWTEIFYSCTKYTDNVAYGTNLPENVTATTGKFWIPSEFEVFGSTTYSNPAEKNFQQQYDFWKNGGSKIFYQGNSAYEGTTQDLTKTSYWWLRSPVTVHSNAGLTLTNYCTVKDSGTPAYLAANESLGFVFGFTVAA